VIIGIESRQFRFVTELAVRLLLPSGMSHPIRPSVFMFLFLQWRICFPLFALHSIHALVELLSFIHSLFYACSGGSAFLYSLVTLCLQWRICFPLLTRQSMPEVADMLCFIHSSLFSCSGGSDFLYLLFTLFLQWRICFPLITLHSIPAVADPIFFIQSSL